MDELIEKFVNGESISYEEFERLRGMVGGDLRDQVVVQHFAGMSEDFEITPTEDGFRVSQSEEDGEE